MHNSLIRLMHSIDRIDFYLQFLSLSLRFLLPSRPCELFLLANDNFFHRQAYMRLYLLLFYMQFEKPIKHHLICRPILFYLTLRFFQVFVFKPLLVTSACPFV